MSRRRVCVRVCVATREPDIRAYVRVALICAHFAIIVRDRIVVGWPWRRGGCVQRCCANSFVIRVVFEFCSQRRAPPFVTARYSVFVVGSSRKSNDLKSYANADSTRGFPCFSSLSATRISVLDSILLFSSLRFEENWNRPRYRFKRKGKLEKVAI